MEQVKPSPAPAATFAYRFHGLTVETYVDDVSLVPDLGRIYPSYAVRAHDTCDRWVALTRTETEYRVNVSGRPGRSCATRLQAIEEYEWALTELLLEAVRDHVHLHASGGVTSDGALLVLGPGGAGKSSIAFAWHGLGVPVLGDDIVLLDAEGRAASFRRLFKLDPRLLTEAGIAPASTPGWEDGCAEAWFEPTANAGWGGPARVRTIAIAQFVPGIDATVRGLPAARGLAALSKSVLTSGRSTVDSFEVLVAATRDTRVVDLTFGSAEAAARLLIEVAAGK